MKYAHIEGTDLLSSVDLPLPPNRYEKFSLGRWLIIFYLLFFDTVFSLLQALPQIEAL
jgi:hypothetical protein